LRAKPPYVRKGSSQRQRGLQKMNGRTCQTRLVKGRPGRVAMKGSCPFSSNHTNARRRSWQLKRKRGSIASPPYSVHTVLLIARSVPHQLLCSISLRNPVCLLPSSHFAVMGIHHKPTLILLPDFLAMDGRLRAGVPLRHDLLTSLLLSFYLR